MPVSALIAYASLCAMDLVVPFARSACEQIDSKTADETTEQLWRTIVTLPERRPQAFDKLKGLANTGDVASTYRLGQCYEMGLGTERNPSAAFQSYLKAAKQYHYGAMEGLIDCYLQGVGTPPDHDAVVAWCRTAVDHGDWPLAAVLRLDYGWRNKNPAKAQEIQQRFLTISKQAASKGDYRGQRVLADAYALGDGIEKSDVLSEQYREEARESLFKAATRGDPEASYYLGSWYESAAPATAIFWYERAFSLGYYNAADSIRALYSANELTQDATLAKKWANIAKDFRHEMDDPAK